MDERMENRDDSSGPLGRATIPPASSVPLVRRWCDGLLLTIVPALCAYGVSRGYVWGLQLLGIQQWTQELLRIGLLATGVLVVFTVVPILTYSFAHQVMIVPWFGKWLREAEAQKQTRMDDQRDQR